jgi:hypothetical protein
MLFFFVAGHALMDYSLQTDPMAVCKCRRANNPIQRSVPWFYWLTAHALLHGAAVGIIVWWGYRDLWGNDIWNVAIGFAIAETVIHWLIDLGKCEKLYGIHVDQSLHLICKVIWWGLLTSGALKSLWRAGT